MFLRALVVVLLAVVGSTCARAADVPVNLSHPRLYFTAADLPRLRALRSEGAHAQIWKNVAESADWCLTRTPRKEWIAPVADDPIYENLYDRFYGIMADLAITEHLAFAYALSGEPRYGDATRDWVLASCRAWKREADDEPNGGKAYAVCRLLKGLAVGYDLAFDRFSDSQRAEVRDTLLAIGRKYYAGYFTTPTIAGPTFHTHHAVVEWASFGVAALAFLGEAPEAQQWLDATTTKFVDHLLPRGLAPDGAQVEGGTFWASTMQYRLFYMDALRRVTGRDLFQENARAMSSEFAVAAVAAHRDPGYDQEHASIAMEPSYGQIDYYAPVLLFLAREYRREICQHFAFWDRALGQIQKTRYVTPHGEPLLFELGGYAFVWYDPTVAARPDVDRLSYYFPSVDQAYLRTSFESDDLLAAVARGQLVLHAGGQPVLIDMMATGELSGLTIQAVEDDTKHAVVHCSDSSGAKTLELRLNRPERKLVIRRQVPGNWSWWCQGTPAPSGNTLTWPGGASLRVTAGDLADFAPEGYGPPLATGFSKLMMADPAPRKSPQISIRPPADGVIELEVRLSK